MKCYHVMPESTKFVEVDTSMGKLKVGVYERECYAHFDEVGWCPIQSSADIWRQVHAATGENTKTGVMTWREAEGLPKEVGT